MQKLSQEPSPERPSGVRGFGLDEKGRRKRENRKPVGLLYAGSATTTVANPIDAVLARFGVTIDGNQLSGQLGKDKVVWLENVDEEELPMADTTIMAAAKSLRTVSCPGRAWWGRRSGSVQVPRASRSTWLARMRSC